MNEKELLKKGTILKAAIRTLGVDVKTEIPGVGEKIKENVEGLYAIKNLTSNDSIPNEIMLFKDIVTKLTPNKDSPLELIKEDKFYVRKKGEETPLLEVKFSKRPKYYSKFTSKGTQMKYIGQEMGYDCLAIATSRECDYFSTKDFCKFCNIQSTRNKSGLPKRINSEDIYELIEETKGKYKFYASTGGTWRDRNAESIAYAELGEIIQKVLKKPFGGPFSFTPPDNLALLERIYQTGVDVISFNREIWNQEAWEKICPGKAKIGNTQYNLAFEYAKNLWGPGNVVVQFLAGPWESNESLIEGCNYYADKGILPNITLFSASPGSVFQNEQSKTLSEIIDLFIKLGEIYKKHPELNTRNSTLTSPSGNRSSLSNEVFKGYLTKENYDITQDLFGISDAK